MNASSARSARSRSLSPSPCPLPPVVIALRLRRGSGGHSTTTTTTSGTGGHGGSTTTTGDAGVCGVAPTKSGADCVLPATITTSTTIGSECQPWTIPAGGTTVGDPANNPVLTIEPCVTVIVEPTGFLNASGNGTGPGGILAKGTAAQPITFTSGAPTPQAGDWGGIAFSDKTLPASSLSNVTLSYAGGAFGTAAAGDNDGSVTVDSTADVTFLFSAVTLTHNAADGMRFTGGAKTGVGFAPGSGNLTITDWGAGKAPIVLTGGDPAATLPTTLTTGASGHDGWVEISGRAAATQVRHRHHADLARHPRPLPARRHAGHLLGDPDDRRAQHPPAPARWARDRGLRRERERLPGGQRHATSPIVFTTSAASPAAASWEGIQYYVTPSGQAASILSFVTIEYAGGTLMGGNSFPNGCGAALASVAIDQVGPNDPGPGPAITNTTIKSFPSGDDAMNVIGTLPNLGSYTAAASNNTFTGGVMGVCPTH